MSFERKGVFVVLLFVLALNFVSAGFETFSYGYAGSVPAPYDYDSDGILDISVYDAGSSPKWYINFSSGVTPVGFPVTSAAFFPVGAANSYPAPGDYDGDGKVDLAYYTPVYGNFTVRNTATGVISKYNWGWNAVVPVSGDYDGDGKTDLAVYYSVQTKWYIQFSNGSVPSWLNNAQWNNTDKSYIYGDVTFKPAQADYDGDGITDLSMVDSNKWYIRFSSGVAPATISNGLSDYAVWNQSGGGYYNLGALKVDSTHLAAPADYNNDGLADFGTYYLYGGGGNWKVLVPTLPSTPTIGSLPGSCNFGQPCSSNINVQGLSSSELEILWTYYYNDSSKRIYCLNAPYNGRFNCTSISSSDASNLRTLFSVGSASTYAIPMLVNDSSGKIINNVGFKVAQRNNGIRSRLSAEKNVSVYYACNSECNTLGATRCAGVLNYQTCVRASPGSSCYVWSANSTCASLGQEYSCSLSMNRCESSAGVNCNGNNAQGLARFCYLSNAELLNINREASMTCPTGQACFVCNQNFSWNAVSASCLRNNPTCVVNGGVCSNYSGGMNINNNLTCASGADSCYVCSAGQHFYNTACISNNCTGVSPAGNNFSNGASTILTGVSNWTYVLAKLPAELGACEWACNSGFRINRSTNNSCEAGLAGCSEVGGLCVSSVGVGMTNLASFGNCSISTQTCVKCNGAAGYSLSGSACVLTCTGGQTWNGTHCISPPGATCNNGCMYNTSCFREGFRLNSQFCNAVSFVAQKSINATCTKNYECTTNFCGPEGKCVSLTQQIAESRGFLRRIWCWISSGFNTSNSNYATCIAAGV